MNPALLADFVSGVHLAIVGFILLGQACVLLGWPLRWNWVRNPWFRFAHLAVMIYVVQNVIRGRLCWLTIWEENLRRQAGQEGSEGSFFGRLLSDILFVQIDHQLLHGMYLAFFAVVLLGFWAVPVRWRRRRRNQPSSLGEE